MLRSATTISTNSQILTSPSSAFSDLRISNLHPSSSFCHLHSAPSWSHIAHRTSSSSSSGERAAAVGYEQLERTSSRRERAVVGNERFRKNTRSIEISSQTLFPSETLLCSACVYELDSDLGLGRNLDEIDY
ncbi:hypothetical protein L1987_43243 [Smallanthus sonchifolius]|uniref:Uncharacterized protein n=1 Tax=Smallanthus sonchifolius TaxID=185202 RepID=A0ACB9GKI8_9ASTR|nr:hypothetical protein L1987_43243 [Smallanthus sonchifolius]